MEKQIELLKSFIALKEAYEGLGLANLWAAHLLAWESRFSSSIVVRQLVATSLRPNDTKKSVVKQKTVFINPSKPVQKVEKCDGCEEARKAVIMKTSYRDKLTGVAPIEPKVMEQPSEDEEIGFNSIEDVYTTYPDLESLMRAAIQLNLRPHPATKEAKLAKMIFDHLNPKK